MSWCGFLFAAHAASPVFESFTSGANGWQGSVTLTGGWSFDGGAAQLSFPTSSIPLPAEQGTISNTASASSGSFTGNFTAAGIESIGFHYYAENIEPSDVVLSFGNQTARFQRNFQGISAGSWVLCSASLATYGAGGWTNALGSPDDFHATLEDVRYVTVRIVRKGVSPSSHTIDDLFLQPLPRAGDAGSPTSDVTALSWNHLLTNVLYDLEQASHVTGAWSVVQTAASTNGSLTFNLTNGPPRQFWRLVLP